MLARAAARRAANYNSTVRSVITQSQHFHRPTPPATANRLLLSRVRVCAFSQTSVCNDESEPSKSETEPDTVDTIASILTPKRTRKPKSEGGAVKKTAKKSEGEASGGDGTEKKKRGRPTETDGGANEAASTKTTSKKSAKKAEPKKAATKKAAKKKAVVPKKKKTLSKEEKQKLQVKELKKIALLDEPRHTAFSPYTVFLRETSKGETASGGFASFSRDNAERFRNLSSADRQRLDSQGKENREKFDGEHKAWVESHTAEEIRDANFARIQLHKLAKITTEDGKKLSISSLPLRVIKDERKPRRTTPYLLFYQQRRTSEEFDGVPVTEAAKAIGIEWKALGEEEVQKYKQEFETRHAEYYKELSELYKTPRKRY